MRRLAGDLEKGALSVDPGVMLKSGTTLVFRVAKADHAAGVAETSVQPRLNGYPPSVCRGGGLNAIFYYGRKKVLQS